MNKTFPEMCAEAQDKVFIESIYRIGRMTHDTAIDKGFNYDDELSKLLMIHTEVSEATEALRKGNPPDDKIPQFSGVEAELADVVLRVLGYAHSRGYRVAEAIVAKHKYNTTRSPMHGGKLF